MNDNTATSVKAVGFGFFSPEVVVMFADHTTSCVHVYPTKNGRQLDLSDSRKHLVLLRALDKKHTLADVGSSIHRLVLFGKPEDVVALGVPLLDATVDDDGKIIPLHKQSRDAMLLRIENEAVALSLRTPVAATSVPLKKEPVAEAAKEEAYVSFVTRLRTLRGFVKKAGNNIDFVADIGMPAVLRIMDDYSREQFKESCKKMVTEGGVPEDPAKDFYRWIEGLGYKVNGLTLGSAVDKHLYSEDDADTDIKQLSQRFGVDSVDIEFVAQSYQQLLKEEKSD